MVGLNGGGRRREFRKRRKRRPRSGRRSFPKCEYQLYQKRPKIVAVASFSAEVGLVTFGLDLAGFFDCVLPTADFLVTAMVYPPKFDLNSRMPDCSASRVPNHDWANRCNKAFRSNNLR